MRKLQLFTSAAVHASEAVDEFFERATEFGVINESDVISVSIMPLNSPRKISSGHEIKDATVEVTIAFWSDKQ